MSDYADTGTDHRGNRSVDPSANDDYQDPSRLEYHQTGDFQKVPSPSGGE